jgi:flagellar motor switch protein FliM
LSEILSQAEISSLLRALPPDEIEGVEEPHPARRRTDKIKSTRRDAHGQRTPLAYELYDFRRPDKFSKDQLRTLQMVHETFARLAGSSLSAYLRTPVTIDLISLEQVPYEEYLRSISHSVFSIISVQPLSGQAVLEIEFGLVFTVIDRMLGGPGRSITRTVLTDIERPLVRETIERMFSSLKAAWEGVVVINPSIDGLETSPQFVQIAPPSDIVVTMLFEVRVGAQRGAMSLCVPYLVLKPITTKLSAQKWFASGTRKANSQTRRHISHQVQQAKIDCSIVLGQARLSAQAFLALQKGDVLRLDNKTTDPLVMRVGEVPKLLGSPALQNKKLVFTVLGPTSE